MKKCDFCSNDLPKWMLYSISNGDESLSICPNCSALGIDDISLNPDAHIKCELCGDVAFEFASDDMKHNLCKNHINKLLRLSLEPNEFMALYIKNPRAYLLHDDFYCPITGQALQPY